MDACSDSVESGDGRSVFAITANGQLKMPRLGNYCVTLLGDGAGASRAIVQDCIEAEDNADARDKFFMSSHSSLPLALAAYVT